MKHKILFVCLGNICRSPSAEAVMKHIVLKKGLENKFYIDSAGTAAYHEGQRADSRMRKFGSKRGYDLTSISRPVDQNNDFEEFDYIIAMDDDNIWDLKRMCPDDKYLSKIKIMTDFRQKMSNTYVPDPYYGGDNGFDLELDILEDSCEGLLKFINSAK